MLKYFGMPLKEVISITHSDHRIWRVMIRGGSTMYAIIATGGKQYKVSEGDIIKVEKLGVAEGETVRFDQVLAVNDGTMKIGTPTVSGVTVTATVVREGKEKKVLVVKYKSKKGERKKNGHRQLFTMVKIDKIND